MKNCFRAPRLFLPRGGFEKWAVPPADCRPRDGDFWERVARIVGNAPSCLFYIWIDHLRNQGVTEKEPAALLSEALADEKLERIGRGFVYTKRKLKGGVRRGIVAALDLEQYAFARSELSPVRATEAPSDRVEALLKLRRVSLLEFPHTVLLYRDKKNALNRALDEYDGLEPLYDFTLLGEGGRISGSFIGEADAYDVSCRMFTRGEPCFAVADGHDELAAAKTYWEELKPTLKGNELKNHPARYALVECINLYDPALELRPVHRLVTGTDGAAFRDYFRRNAKSSLRGDLIACELPAGAEGVRRADEIVSSYLRANGGSVRYCESEEELVRLAAAEEGVGVLMRPMDKEDLFYELKSGELMPPHTFTLGEENRRYCLEGREISYD